jgi:hypothetical protein
MKTQKLNGFLLVLLVTGWMGADAQTTLESEVPGDNFSLEGALELFKKSDSPQQFEEMLNSANSKVNNLDLNNDGNIDYIRVIDRNEGNVHAFIIQAVLSDVENQDVAVIELEKLNNGKAVLQITGDADVYGIETIIEPTEEVRINAGTTTARTVVNVWTWPSVQYVYGPSYSVWVSPWSWAYHPMWWRPWRPVAYYVYDPWWRPYRSYYSVCHSHRIGYLPRLYRPYRTTSVIVHNNYRHQIDRYRSHNNGRDRYDGRHRDGGSRDGYSRTRTDERSRGDHNTRQRHNADASASRNRSRSVETTRSDDHRNGMSTRRSALASERTLERSPSVNNNSRQHVQRTPEIRQRKTERSNLAGSHPQRQVRTASPGNLQQRHSAPRSFDRSSPAREIKSGNRSGSGGDSRSIRRGRH